MKKLTPRKVWDASNILNYVFFKIADKHLRTDYFKAYKGSRFAAQGDVLAELTELTYQNDYEGDIRMVDEWARFLGFTGWFGWTGFKDVPDAYLRT